MATEKLSNDAVTTLDGAINNSVTTLTVISATAFPTTGNFRIKIGGTEICLVTAVSGLVFTITRGVEGSSASSHSSGESIILILTKDSLNKLFCEENSQEGTYANLPSAEKAGRIYRSSDSIYDFRDSGSAWVAYGPRWKLTPLPNNHLASWINQNSAIASYSNGMLSFRSSVSSNDHHSILYRAAPTPPYTITVLVEVWPILTASFNSFNFVFLDSASGKFSNIQLAYNTSTGKLRFDVEKWDDFNSFNAGYALTEYPITPQTYPKWVRLVDDNTNRKWQVSWDGFYWRTVHSIGRTDFITPDSVGFSLRQDGTDNAEKVVSVYSWLSE